MTDEVIDKTKTKVQLAEDALALVESRKSEIASRLNEIAGELDAKRKELGEVKLSRSPTAKVHQAIDQLEREKSELTEEGKATLPVIEAANKDLRQAQKEEAVIQYQGLLKEAANLGIEIYQGLYRAYAQLSEVAALQYRMADLAKIAGDPLPTLPVEPVYIHPTIGGFVEKALETVVRFNTGPYDPDRLTPNGLKNYQYVERQ